jgi:hypothetical protein
MSDFINDQLALNFSIEVGRANLHEALRSRIVYLLLHDLTTLWNALYRIDVNEGKAKALFEGKPEKIAEGLTELILQRLAEKEETRRKYRT